MEFAEARAQLISSFKNEISDKRVLAAMGRVPRELFITPDSRDSAYEDRPLPIGFGQTISQPYIIALMTQALELTGQEKVLEIGTGSGYQTAILAELARSVISTERVPALAESATKLLHELGYKNVKINLAGETLGWPAEAPYDAIIVTAGAPSIPGDLLKQLSIGGRMVIPVGTLYLQELLKITRGQHKDNVVNLGGCAFVPLVGKGGWDNSEQRRYDGFI